MSEDARPGRDEFLVTKEYRRFAEFCDACRRDCYIGLCYGPPGVGKTLSARYYARWDAIEAGLAEQRTTLGADISPALAGGHTLVYTPTVSTTARRLGEDLTFLSVNFNELIRSAREAADRPSVENARLFAGWIWPHITGMGYYAK